MAPISAVKLKEKTEFTKSGRSLKDGPVIYQSESDQIDGSRGKKDLTLAELNHLFKMFLHERGSQRDDISIVGQFSVIYDDPVFSSWHKLSKEEQSKALSDQVIMPAVYDDLITPVGTAAGDDQIIKGVVKDAVQNAIDSFSHAAFLQKKYITRFPGIKIILFMDQVSERLILTVIDNGFGAAISKPRKSYTGEDYSDDFVSKIVDWIVRRFGEKDGDDARNDIAYTGGQGMAFKKLKIELHLDVQVHYLASGAAFELILKNYF
ncbi:MAG: hypothetical protein ABW168_26290 [Sedimenticola sp.]